MRAETIAESRDCRKEIALAFLPQFWQSVTTMNRTDTKHRPSCVSSDVSGHRRKQVIVESDQRLHLDNAPNRPASIPFFVERLVNAAAAPKPRPRIGTLCNFIPVEIILAAGADTVRLDCGNSAAALAGEEHLAGDICPLAQATLGLFLREDGIPSTCDAFVIPASCDAKRKLAEILADFGPVFQLAMPVDPDPARHAEEIIVELKRLAAFVTDITGHAPNRADLHAAISLTARRSDLIRRLQDARIAQPGSLSIRDLFVTVQASLFSPEPIETWLKPAEILLSEVQACVPEPRSFRRRVVLTGSPIVWPNFKPLNLLELCGADVVADTICTGAHSCSDPALVAGASLEAAYRGLAERAAFGLVCPCFCSQATRLNRIIDLVEKRHADGVVQYALRFCHAFDLENCRIERTLRDRRIPFLNLSTDYNLEDTERLRARIELFLETL
jgi:benzoyl-CoA reductase/2-hydroxyglutaryl-CoA dehydratase subunit BcrC/BadD/HgdB